MRKLATYSIETDHTVRLDFADGQRMRVPVAKLSMYLHAPDLQRVERAVKMRRQFILRHMPKVIIGVAAAGLLTTAIVTPRSLNRLLAPTGAPAPAPGQSVAIPAQQLTPTKESTATSHTTGSVQSAHTQATTGAGSAAQDSQKENTADSAQNIKASQNLNTSSPSTEVKTGVTPKPKVLKVTLPLPVNLSLPLL